MSHNAFGAWLTAQPWYVWTALAAVLGGAWGLGQAYAEAFKPKR